MSFCAGMIIPTQKALITALAAFNYNAIQAFPPSGLPPAAAQPFRGEKRFNSAEAKSRMAARAAFELSPSSRACSYAMIIALFSSSIASQGCSSLLNPSNKAGGTGRRLCPNMLRGTSTQFVR
jgi:hypothetical protein